MQRLPGWSSLKRRLSNGADSCSTSKFVRSKESGQVAQRVWDESNEKLEKIQPGVVGNI